MSRRYRDLAAWRLGRPLRPWETVRHIDSNHTDDHPDNLLVLPGPRAHVLLHWYERREAKGVQHLWPLEEWLELSTPRLIKAALAICHTERPATHNSTHPRDLMMPPAASELSISLWSDPGPAHDQLTTQIHALVPDARLALGPTRKSYA